MSCDPGWQWRCLDTPYLITCFQHVSSLGAHLRICPHWDRGKDWIWGVSPSQTSIKKWTETDLGIENHLLLKREENEIDPNRVRGHRVGAETGTMDGDALEAHRGEGAERIRGGIENPVRDASQEEAEEVLGIRRQGDLGQARRNLVSLRWTIAAFRFQAISNHSFLLMITPNYPNYSGYRGYPDMGRGGFYGGPPPPFRRDERERDFYRDGGPERPRSRDRERERDRDGDRKDGGDKKVDRKAMEEKKKEEEQKKLAEMTKDMGEEEKMMLLMGFGGFDSTKVSILV
jgi:hypothetical protein